MALHGHTCGISAAMSGMLHRSGGFKPSISRRLLQASKPAKQVHFLFFASL